MLTKILGAGTLLLCTGALALREKQKLARRVRQTGELLSLASELRREVCLLQTPQPELLRLLGANPWDRKESFQKSWERAVEALELNTAEQTAMKDFARRLALGEEPELVLESLEQSLKQCRAAAEREREERERLVPGSILCIGALLVIMLL